jgi:hypothetical protein
MRSHKGFADLIGKKIVAYRGRPHTKEGWAKKIFTDFEFILFEDNIIVELREQDPYSYHDCSISARTLHIFQDHKLWQEMFNKEGYQEPDRLDL